MASAYFSSIKSKVFETLESGQEVSVLGNITRDIKAATINCGTDVEVSEFVSMLLVYFRDFFTKDLEDALNIDESRHYFKMLKVSTTLPYALFPWIYSYPTSLIWIPEGKGGRAYETLKYLYEEYDPEAFKKDVIKKAFAFIEKNPNITYGSTDTYYPLEKELDLYRATLSGINTQELMEFENEHQRYGMRQEFINKRLGNIGELYAFSLIQDAEEKYLVAKDFKNGFGYDIYTYARGIENLIEVKTTSTGETDDYFSMSANEYTIMLETINNPYARYYVYRVYLSYDRTIHAINLFVKDENTLGCLEDPSIEYKLEVQGNRYIFKRYTPTRSF